MRALHKTYFDINGYGNVGMKIFDITSTLGKLDRRKWLLLPTEDTQIGYYLQNYKMKIHWYVPNIEITLEVSQKKEGITLNGGSNVTQLPFWLTTNEIFLRILFNFVKFFFV